MEKTSRESYRAACGPLARGQAALNRRDAKPAPSSTSPGSALLVGAKTIAGVGLGLIAVMAGAVVIGLASEAVLVPSLMLKLAGGLAGGGVGMAKGLKDTRKGR